MSFVCRPCRCRLGIYPDRKPHRCPRCAQPMVAELPTPPDGFALFDHTYTPGHAQVILDRVPADSHHWADIARIGNGRVVQFTALMLAGQWQNELAVHGHYEHPIRFDGTGYLTHGIMRLLACAASGSEFRSVTYCPIGFLPEVFAWQPA